MELKGSPIRWAVLLVGVALCLIGLAAAPHTPPALPADYHLAESFARGSLDGWVTSSGKKANTGVDTAYTQYDGRWAVEELALASSSPDGGPLRGDNGLVLKSKAAHAAISAKLRRPFVFAEERPLVVQYEVNFQRGIDCGGAYVKLLTHDPADPAGLDLGGFTDRTPYTLMFGPDKCGDEFKLHLIVKHRNPATGEVGEHHAKKPAKQIRTYFTDKKTHLYTLVLTADSGFQILVDGELVNSGNLLTDMLPALNGPQEIDDPEDTKPAEWDDRRTVPDPTAVKPEDWDDDEPREVADEDAVMPDGWLEEEPESVEDPDAVRPEDWDEDMDGEWEAPEIGNPRCNAEDTPGCGPWTLPMVPNPLYKGKWKAPKVANAAYSGEWRPRAVPNPDHIDDLRPFAGLSPLGAVGLELWSMSEDIFFDNFLIASDREAAARWAEQGWRPKKEAEDAAAAGRAEAEEAGRGSKGQAFGRAVDWLSANRLYAAVLLLVALLPVALHLYAGRKKGGKVVNATAKTAKTDYKKTDEPQPDVKDEDEEEEDEEEEEEEDKKKEEDNKKEKDAVKYHQTYK